MKVEWFESWRTLPRQYVWAAQATKTHKATHRIHFPLTVLSHLVVMRQNHTHG
jgi:hypothetical protein